MPFKVVLLRCIGKAAVKHIVNLFSFGVGGDREVVELLGVGGFGEVWKPRNPHSDGVAPVAWKFCLDATARERLLKHEAAVLNQVMQQGKHEGIVPLLHTYLSADPPCLAY